MHEDLDSLDFDEKPPDEVVLEDFLFEEELLVLLFFLIQYKEILKPILGFPKRSNKEHPATLRAYKPLHH